MICTHNCMYIFLLQHQTTCGHFCFRSKHSRNCSLLKGFIVWALSKKKKGIAQKTEAKRLLFALTSSPFFQIESNFSRRSYNVHFWRNETEFFFLRLYFHFIEKRIQVKLITFVCKKKLLLFHSKGSEGVPYVYRVLLFELYEFDTPGRTINIIPRTEHVAIIYSSWKTVYNIKLKCLNNNNTKSEQT